jgi:hypothetical protein
VLTDRAEIDRVAAIAARAGAMKMKHEPTQAELHSLMRFSPRAAARKRDGLDLELFFTPTVAARIAAVATHPRVLGALGPLGAAEMVARDVDEAPLRSAPVLCLLHAESLEAETFLRGGACFEEVALDVTDAGLAMALHSAPIEVGLSHPGRPHPSVPGEWHASIAEVRRELLPARVADPRPGAPEPPAGASRAAARDRSLPGDDPAQPAVAQPEGAGRAAWRADPRGGLRQHRRGDGRATRAAGRGALRRVRAR